MKLAPGTRVGTSAWAVVSPLGQGQFGEVWEVEHEVTHKRGACKVLKPVGAGAKGDVIRDKTLKAARLLARADHPGLVEVYDAGFLSTTPPRNWVVMERLRGRELADVMKEGPVQADRALRYLEEAAAAIAVVAREGVIHRDLKPANLFVTEHDRIKVLDFDSAHMPRAQSMVGQVMGTPFYMSPEHWQGKPLDSRTDVWALGIILYEMLTGAQPFGAGNIGQLAATIFTQPLPPPASPLPPDVWALLERATQKSADDRYPDIAAFAEALRALREARAQPQPEEPPRSEALSALAALDGTQMMAGDLAAELAALDLGDGDVDGTVMMNDGLAAELDAIGDGAGDIDGTVMLGDKLDLGDALPFDKPAPTSQVSLTAEQYASLCAECMVHPHAVEAIRTRYGLRSAADHQALEARWQTHFAHHPDARAAHEQRVHHYVGWLRAKR